MPRIIFLKFSFKSRFFFQIMCESFVGQNNNYIESLIQFMHHIKLLIEYLSKKEFEILAPNQKEIGESISLVFETYLMIDEHIRNWDLRF
ncbi:hypothetical protein BpHYR1_024620 [Brachionus plicatilis]|uniref:Uncharacterized protein n=1 Tax=Brachionus plicatilis TaxID=10195 RepID=A0A3M7SRL2_BRAPC|nr:hypothetical protein BpHYR1_024620 [Brachionus plicatilis]